MAKRYAVISNGIVLNVVVAESIDKIPLIEGTLAIASDTAGMYDIYLEGTGEFVSPMLQSEDAEEVEAPKDAPDTPEENLDIEAE